MIERRGKKGGAHLQKKEPRQRTRKEKIRLAVVLALVVLLALLVCGFTAFRAWAKPPEVSVRPPEKGDEPLPTIVPGVEVVGDRKKDFYTFLVVGRDTGGGGNTDTIILAAYDIPNQKLSVMSIPRDTMVNISKDIKRINAVYNYAGGGEKGIQALYQEVSQLVGFVPDHEIVLEWDAVGQLVEAMDGVWFDVPRNMHFDDPTQNLHIHIDKGYQLLNGEDAMGVLRWRMNNDNTGYVDGDIGRIETQQAFLKAVISQCLQVKNVTKIQQFATVFTENVQTDLTMGNLAWFAEQAVFGGLSMDNVTFLTLPGNYSGEAWSRTYKKYQSYVLPDGEKLLNAVNENFNPFLEDRTLTELDIMSVNPDGSLSSTTGVVEDKKAAVPPVIPTPEPEPTPEVSEEPEQPEQPEQPTEPETPSAEPTPENPPEGEGPLPEESEENEEENTVPVLPPMHAAA